MDKKSPYILLFVFCFALVSYMSQPVYLPRVWGGGGVSQVDAPKQLVPPETGQTNCCPDEPKVYKLTRPYMKAEELKEFQIALRDLGCYKGTVNGVYDKAMEAAVKKFQTVHRLEADGVLGPGTYKELARLFEGKLAHVTSKHAPKGNVEILIDVDTKTLSILNDGKVFKKYACAVGKDESPTPIGEFRIERKAKNWGTGFGTRWLGLDVSWGIYGIHGTNKPWSIGSSASHGCIRMFNQDVEEIYPWVKAGTKVTIVGQVYPPLYEQRDKVFRGSIGSAVILVQKGLAAEGYLKAKPDGVFGFDTEDALKRLQKDRGFEVTGQVDVDIWPVLGL